MLLKANMQNFCFHEEGVDDLSLFLPLRTIMYKTNMEYLKGGEKEENCQGLGT